MSVEGQASGLNSVITMDENQVMTWDDLVVAAKPSEQMLAFAYLRFEREGILPMLFYEGVPKLSWFMAQYSDILSLGCYLKDPDGNTNLAGLGWVNAMTMMGSKHKKAEVGMGFFRGAHPGKVHRFGMMMIEWAFSIGGLSALHGATPVKNIGAVRYMRSLGFEHFGPVEGYCSWQGELSACEISAMTKERWDHLRPFTVVRSD